MGKRIYRLAGRAIRLFSHRMKTIWEEPFTEGPCVFVANQMGAHGPADMCAKFPMRDKIHPWINSELLSMSEAPDYIRKSFWWKPENPLSPLMNRTVPHLGAAVLQPILKGADYIPVYRDQRSIVTFRQSIRALQKGHYLLIFPEISNGWRSHAEQINTGWLRLGELWYRASGRKLRMYPVHLDCEKHEFHVAAPVEYEPSKSFREQEKSLADRLARGLRGQKEQP